MKTWLKITLSALFTIGVIVLLVLVEREHREMSVSEPIVNIDVKDQEAFLTKPEVLRRLNNARLYYEGQTFEELDLDSIERFVASISQVKTVDTYRTFGNEWKVDIQLRKPIARIFNNYDETFYLSSDGYTMLTSPIHTARIVVVTGEIEDRQNSETVDVIINNDSLKSIRKLDDIYRITNYVCNDPLLGSLIGQLHLNKWGEFVMIPIVGDQRIVFGSAYTEKEVEEKFEKLKVFYEEAIEVEGWNKYSEISLKYDGQIVCKKKLQGE